MLIGGNSRTVAAVVDVKMQEINRSLPPGIEAKTVLNRTLLVDATIRTVAKNLAEGTLLVVLVLFLLLGALDFGLIVDGAVIIAENSLRRLGERQHQLGRILDLDERLATVTSSAKQMIQPTSGRALDLRKVRKANINAGL
jgi:cobalt-zinc-cadmium resistance protein CzcA